VSVVPARDLLGVPIALTDYERALDAMEEMIAAREQGYVCAVPVHSLMVSRHDLGMQDALLGATMNLPDGRPLVWALNMLGERLPDRVYGPDLMDRFCARAARRGHRIWLYGGATDAALADLVHALERRHPGLQVAGGWSPPHRPLTPTEEQEVAQRIDSDRADVVWVGLGVPKQELWMARMRSRLQAPVLVGVGAAFDFLAGRKRQAPAWMQARGLEWLFRLSQEPFRLLPRYLRYNPAFVVAFARQYLRERRQRRRNGRTSRSRRRRSSSRE
jgi:N-acetylglucosaminyldiphosphoundecaprenol N-acetyl-beta-D-mannosaminyltransferase